MFYVVSLSALLQFFRVSFALMPHDHFLMQVKTNSQLIRSLCQKMAHRQTRQSSTVRNITIRQQIIQTISREVWYTDKLVMSKPTQNLCLQNSDGTTTDFSISFCWFSTNRNATCKTQNNPVKWKLPTFTHFYSCISLLIAYLSPIICPNMS